MKRLLILTIVTLLIITTYDVKAQQPKAYETIRFKAHNKNISYLLDYADGYLAASRIKLQQNNRKPILFTPNNGVSDDSGILEFRSTDKNAKITIVNVNEEQKIPKLIQGTYRFNNQIIRLRFLRQ